MSIEMRVHASLTVRHERPYDYDEARGLWLYERVDDDEQYENILTDAGRVTIHTFIYGTVEQRVAAEIGSGFNFIGVSNDAAEPTAEDTALAAELSANGLARVLGTVALPTGSETVTLISKQFTYTGDGTQGVRKTALFDDLTAGNMAHEILFAQRTLATSDTITLRFSIVGI